MIEEKYIKKIMTEYKNILEKYEFEIEKFGVYEIKKLIGEVRLFWYRYHKFINYFLNNIEKKDKVAYLAGATKLDILNKGHFEFILAGKYRIINDPIIKLASFYKAKDNDVNFEYINKYMKDSINELLVILNKYFGDFYIIPIEYFKEIESKEYNLSIMNLSEKILLSLFSKEYLNEKDLVYDNNSYEEIEEKLLQNIKNNIIFSSISDMKLPLRERINNYLEISGDIVPFINECSESEKFCIILKQYLIQAIVIFELMNAYNLIPFIRNDVVFNYFTLIFSLNSDSNVISKEYLEIYILYIIQNEIEIYDKKYEIIKKNIGLGKLSEYVMNKVIINNYSIEKISKKKIKKYIKEYMNDVLI